MTSRWLFIGWVLILGLSGCVTQRLGPFSSEAAPVHARSDSVTAQRVSDSDPAAGRLRPLAEDRPVAITSDRLSYTEQGRVTVFLGHVKVNQESTRLEAPYLEVRSQDGQAFAKRGIRLTDLERGITVTARELEYKDNLAHTQIRGRVRVESHDEEGIPLRVTSERLEWNTRKKEIKARERVKILYRGSTATAEAMDYDQMQQRVELIHPQGSSASPPRIEQNGDIITGDRLFLYLKERRYEAQGSASADIMPSAGSSASRRLPMKEKP